MNKDVFICHASEDKAAIVRPLCKALEQVQISYWLDEQAAEYYLRKFIEYI